jgi:hypothetical protein
MAWHHWQSNDYGSCREDLPSLLLLLLLLLLYYDAQALPVGILVLILATTFEEYLTVRSTLRYDTEYSEREQHHYGGNRAPIFGGVIIIHSSRAFCQREMRAASLRREPSPNIWRSHHHPQQPCILSKRNASSIITAGTEPQYLEESSSSTAAVHFVDVEEVSHGRSGY